MSASPAEGLGCEGLDKSVGNDGMSNDHYELSERTSGRSEVVLFDSKTVERRLEFGVTVPCCPDARAARRASPTRLAQRQVRGHTSNIGLIVAWRGPTRDRIGLVNGVE